MGEIRDFLTYQLLRRTLVAFAGGCIAIFLAVLLNRLLIFLGLSLVTKHPETGGVKLTLVAGVALVVGVAAAAAGMLSSDDLVDEKVAELTAAIAGGLAAIYLGVVTAVISGVFAGGHFQTLGLVLLGVILPILMIIVAIVLSRLRMLWGDLQMYRRKRKDQRSDGADQQS